MMKFHLSAATSRFSWVIALIIGLLVGIAVKSPFPGEDMVEGRDPVQRNLSKAEADVLKDEPRSSKLKAKEERTIEDHLQGLSEVLNQPNRVMRTRAILALIDHLEVEDFENVVTGFRESGWVEYNRQEFSLLISAWMDQSPEEAIAYLDEFEPDGWTRKIAVAAWAAEYPESAADAVKNLQDYGQVNDWFVGLIQGMARQDPDSALSTLETIPNNATREAALHNLLPEVVSRGPNYASDWLNGIEEPALQRDSAKQLAKSLSRHDPTAASDWITSIEMRSSRREASEIVADAYAATDVDAAKEWAEGLPQDTMTEAAEGVARHLTRRDPGEAARWLTHLGDDPDLDGARRIFLREARDRDPEMALDNVPTLSEEGLQSRFYKTILRSWRKTDPEAAMEWAWANSESLPPSIVGQLPARTE